MGRNVLTYIFLFLYVFKANATGFDIKTSALIDQPSVEVLGDYVGSWYAIAFERPGNLNKPPKYKLLKYNADFHNAKSSPMYPSFGEKTLYLKSAVINNKISMFYSRCDRRVEENDMMDSREGRRQIPDIFKQDYDPNTLEAVGGPQSIFDEDEDRFASSGIDIATSEDKSKMVLLIKPYYHQQKYKLIVTDNQKGQLYSRLLDFKSMKEYLKFQDIKINNQGQILITTKVRGDVISMATVAKDKKPVLYYFFAISGKDDEPKILPISYPVEKNIYPGQPVTAMLSTGEMAIAYTSYATDKNPVVKEFYITTYNRNFNVVATRNIVPDEKTITAATEYMNTKREYGLPYLEIKTILPLNAGGAMLIAEYNRTTENTDKTKPRVIERNYMLAYRLDDKMNVKYSHLIPKKQTTSKVGYALSLQACRKGNDVYIIHNDDWTSDEEHDTNLQCTYLAANGVQPETKKITHTSDDFLTSMENIYPRSDGKFLFTEEKLVEFDGVSREVKLLEVTIK